MIEYLEKELEGVIAVKIVDSLNQEDYETLVPEIKKKIKKRVKVSLYWEIPEEAELGNKAFWSDIHFNLRHACDVKKVALVGRKPKERVRKLAEPFSNARVRYYNPSDRQQAMDWVKV